MLPDHIYASMKRDELWRFGRGRAELVERRDEAGHAFTTTRAGALEIHATDHFDQAFSSAFTPPHQVERRLRDAFITDEAEVIRRAVAAADAAVRIVTVARYVENEHRSHISCSTTATATIQAGGDSITTTAATVEADLRELLGAGNESDPLGVDYRQFPIVWGSGTASVLLHEAIGHPAERDIFAEAPAWLVVSDHPREPIDDVAHETITRILTRGEQPSAIRRMHFLSVPIRRISNLIVSAAADVDLPQRRLEISMVEEGAFDPLDDRVTVQVQRAAVVDQSVRRPVKPFEFTENRVDLMRHLQGAIGPKRRYPGTICGDEANRLFVGGLAPDLLTAPFQ